MVSASSAICTNQTRRIHVFNRIRFNIFITINIAASAVNVAVVGGGV